MRFDPQANFVGSDGAHAGENGPTELGRSPLKAAVAIVFIAFLAGIGLWIWSEGLPGQKAAAETSDNKHVDSSVVKYAEAVISAKSSAEAAAALTGDSSPKGSEAFRRLQRKKASNDFKQEFRTGKKYMSMGLHERALPHLVKAVRLEPGIAEAHYRLGICYVHTGNNRQALEQQIVLQQLNPDLANLLAHLINN